LSLVDEVPFVVVEVEPAHRVQQHPEDGRAHAQHHRHGVLEAHARERRHQGLSWKKASRSRTRSQGTVTVHGTKEGATEMTASGTDLSRHTSAAWESCAV